jgi:CTP:phosphocholine cytidylyltransferase-like protein
MKYSQGKHDVTYWTIENMTDITPLIDAGYIAVCNKKCYWTDRAERLVEQWRNQVRDNYKKLGIIL